MNFKIIIGCLTALCTFTVAHAVAHDHHDHLGGPMKHVSITLDETTLQIHIDPTVETPILQNLLLPGHAYDGAKVVLNDIAHNAQYGWMAGGFITLPSQSGIFIRLVDQTPGLRTYAQDDYSPLFGTDGTSDLWRWPGTMVHNWYAIDLDAITFPEMAIFATYEAYIGSISPASYGEALPGYTSAMVTLNWTAVPEPSLGLGLIGAGLVLGGRRRAMRGILAA